MAFCKFSSESVISSTTAVDNIFIHNYLPSAPDVCVKVYLYGLYKCGNPNSFNNTIEGFAEELGLSIQDIEDAFLYWQEQGLVNVIMSTECQVRYLPLNNILTNTKKFKKDKYTDFNKQAQEIIDGRMMTANEYGEYYLLMETYHIEPMALIMIMQYCASLKGHNIGYSYITTVARNWAQEGITTTLAVEEKIKELGTTTSEISEILKISGIRRSATVEEQEKFLRWTKALGFPLDAVEFVAKNIKLKHGRASFERIDASLQKLSEIGKFSVKEIEEYQNNQAQMLEIAKNTCRNIGVFYSNLDIVVETYISNWLELGHTEDSILKLASYCFKSNIRTLSALDDTILKLYKLGIVTSEAIDQYFGDILQETNEIKEILEKLGLSRMVTTRDREFVHTWKYVWNTSDDVLDFAVEKAVNKTNPMQYINKLLATWHNENLKTLDEVQKFAFEKFEKPKTSPKTPKNTPEREYKKEELEHLFKSLDEIVIE